MSDDAAGKTEKADPAAPAATATQGVVDDARFAAQGLRSTALWIGSALAAIPSIALVGTLLKPPEGSSFTPWMLGLGVLLATGGALYGILSLAAVSEPVAIEDSNLDAFSMARVIEAVDPTYPILVERIRRAHEAATTAATRAGDLQIRADKANAVLASATALAEKLQALAKDSNSSSTRRDADDARDALAAASVAAGNAAGNAAAAATMRAHAERQLAAALGIRKAVFSLLATDVVSKRYRTALNNLVKAVAAVAVGVALIVLSPASKDDAAATPKLSDLGLITFTLTETGKKKICDTARPITALRLTADAEKPTVITFPRAGCPSKKVVLLLAKPGADASLVQQATSGG